MSKFIVITPRKAALRVLDQAPKNPDAVAVEVTDEVGASVKAIIEAREQALFIGGTFVSRRSLVNAGTIPRWDDEAKEWTTAPIVRPERPVPVSVPLWAFRAILIEDGLLGAVISAANDEVKNFLEYGNTVERKSPALVSLATQLGKTEEDVDNLFRRAGSKKL